MFLTVPPRRRRCRGLPKRQASFANPHACLSDPRSHGRRRVVFYHNQKFHGHNRGCLPQSHMTKKGVVGFTIFGRVQYFSWAQSFGPSVPCMPCPPQMLFLGQFWVELAFATTAVEEGPSEGHGASSRSGVAALPAHPHREAGIVARKRVRSHASPPPRRTATLAGRATGTGTLARS